MPVPDPGPRSRRLPLAACAWAVNLSFSALVVTFVVLIVGGEIAAVLIWGERALIVGGVPSGLLLGAAWRLTRAVAQRTTPPAAEGVRVSRSAQPGLWALVDAACPPGVASPVDELRLVFDGSPSCGLYPARRWRHRCVLVLPLSYLAVLGEPELRAVIAHETAHAVHGDLRFTQRTTVAVAALERAHRRLTRTGSILRYPFGWYRRSLHRRLAALSRRAELEADAHSASLTGPHAAARALRITTGTFGAFSTYWNDWVAPALEAGMRPPIAEGFRELLSASAGRIPSWWEAGDEDDELRTHPTLVQRLAALGCDGDATPAEVPCARTLLAGGRELELELLVGASPTAAHLTPVGWAEAIDVLLPRAWAARTASRAEIIADAVAAEIPRRLAAWGPVGPQQTVELLACALADALHRDGWTIAASPGGPIVLERDGVAVRPFDDIRALRGSGLLDDEWGALCAQAGIAALPLAVGAAGEESVAVPAAGAATAPAPSGVVTLALDPAERARGLSRGAVRFAWFIFAALLAIVTGGAVTSPAPFKTDSLIVVAAMSIVWAAYLAVTRPARPEVSLGPDGLALVHPGLLREPLRIPRAAVRAIAVDDASDARGRRFAILDASPWRDPRGGDTRPRGWFLAEGRAARPCPHYALHRQAPNVLVVLDVARAGPRVRRERLHGPLNGETLAAFTLRVAEPERARRALDELGLARPLTVEDLRPARSPDPVAAPV